MRIRGSIPAAVLRLLSRAFLMVALAAGLGLMAMSAFAQQPAARAVPGSNDYPMGPGDVVKITVFQSADLSVETRISESGTITYPLIGVLKLGGLTPQQAERLIASQLRDREIMQNPQVTINVTQFRSQQVSVLGKVNRPGRYPLETTGMRLTEVLAQAGGIAENGSDTVIVQTERNGKPVTIQVDIAEMYLKGERDKDIPLQAGDSIYVYRAPQFYIYGQVNRPGNYVLERNLTVAQAIAKGGGITLRGTDRGVRLQRRDAKGNMQTIEPRMEDPVNADDIIFVREALF